MTFSCADNAGRTRHTTYMAAETDAGVAAQCFGQYVYESLKQPERIQECLTQKYNYNPLLVGWMLFVTFIRTSFLSSAKLTKRSDSRRNSKIIRNFKQFHFIFCKLCVISGAPLKWNN